MKLGSEQDTVRANRYTFFTRHDIKPFQASLVNLAYEGDNYLRFHTIDKSYKGSGITHRSSLVSDSLFVVESGHALFLPLADCIGAVLYDATRNIFGLAHLGRHNLVQEGGMKNIEYMQQEFGSKPRDISVFMSAAAGKNAYPLHAFDGKSLHEVAAEQFQRAGIAINQIEIDTRDTITDSALFSHSNYLAGKQSSDGRHALVAIMR
jgi:copper oxidase (laccase) domain-containing protein